jgi:hypothetical protein
MTSSSVTEDNFEAAIVESKRKGVARVEAFLDMMTYKGNDDASNGASSDDRNEANSPSKSNDKDEENKNSSTTTSSSQSPSPPTFSSSSPDESLNRY